MANETLEPAELRMTAQYHRDCASRERNPDKQKMHIRIAIEYETLADEIEANAPGRVRRH
jgi:hypothetical protein